MGVLQAMAGGAASGLEAKPWSGDVAARATTARPIATNGELFADGSTIELVRDGAEPALMLWDLANEVVGKRIEHNGRIYEPAAIDSSILHQLLLPTQCCPHGTTRKLLTQIRELVMKFVGLDDKSASLVARMVLSSAIVEAVSLAPALVIVGPDTTRANRLIALMRCLCRHSVSLTGVTPAGFRSLANNARFTFLISQGELSKPLQNLLHDASRRERKIPFCKRFLDLFGVQVIRADSALTDESWAHRSIEIAMLPAGQLPAFDQDVQEQIANEFQARLLSFRRATLGAARQIQFDVSKFDQALRDLAASLAATTPDDEELQTELFDLLKEKNAEFRSEKWTSVHTAAITAVLVAEHDSPGGEVYVGELASLAQELLWLRGSTTEITPAALGTILKRLGFATEPRDSKGKKLNLAVAAPHARQLARDFEVPEVG